jgi:hypothetical protein
MLLMRQKIILRTRLKILGWAKYGAVGDQFEVLSYLLASSLT